LAVPLLGIFRGPIRVGLKLRNLVLEFFVHFRSKKRVHSAVAQKIIVLKVYKSQSWFDASSSVVLNYISVSTCAIRRVIVGTRTLGKGSERCFFG